MFIGYFRVSESSLNNFQITWKCAIDLANGGWNIVREQAIIKDHKGYQGQSFSYIASQVMEQLCEHFIRLDWNMDR